MKKNLLISIVTIMLVVLMVTGCGAPADLGDKDEAEPNVQPSQPAAPQEQEEKPPEEQITIDFMNFSANEGGRTVTLELMKELFEKEHPNITVNIETFGWDDYFTQLQTRVGGGDAPDCFEVNFESFVGYAGQDALMNLTDLMTASGIDKGLMTEKSLKAFSMNGVRYGLPYSYSTVILVYNKDLFDQAQIAYPDDSWTWVEVDAAAEKIKALGDDYFGIIQPIQTWEFFKVVQQNGGSLLNEDNTEFTVNTPQNVETLQHAVDRVLVSNISPSIEQMGSLDEWGVFKLGKSGMIVTGTWCFPSFIDECNFNWDIALEPGKTSRATHYFANGLCVSSETPHAQAAYEWIKFLTTNERMAKARIESGWELPCVTYPAVLEEYMLVTPPENKQAVFDSLEYVIPQPQIADFNMMADILTQELQGAAAGVKTPQQALDDAQAALSGAINLQ